MVIKGYLLPFIGQLVNRILVSHAPHAACRRHPLVWLNWAKGYQELGQICSKFATISALSTQSTERRGRSCRNESSLVHCPKQAQLNQFKTKLIQLREFGTTVTTRDWVAPATCQQPVQCCHRKESGVRHSSLLQMVVQLCFYIHPWLFVVFHYR